MDEGIGGDEGLGVDEGIDEGVDEGLELDEGVHEGVDEGASGDERGAREPPVDVGLGAKTFGDSPDGDAG